MEKRKAKPFIAANACDFRAYMERSDLTDVIIPDSVSEIGEAVFDSCTGLTSVVISESVTEIGLWTFFGCTGLTSVKIPRSVTKIGQEAFGGCTGLTSVEIPDDAEIAKDAFPPSVCIRRKKQAD